LSWVPRFSRGRRVYLIGICSSARLAVSAAPASTDHPSNLLPDQLLDDAGKMFIKPGLQHRPQHVSDHVLERTVGTPKRKLSFPASRAW